MNYTIRMTDNKLMSWNFHTKKMSHISSLPIPGKEKWKKTILMTDARASVKWKSLSRQPSPNTTYLLGIQPPSFLSQNPKGFTRLARPLPQPQRTNSSKPGMVFFFLSASDWPGEARSPSLAMRMSGGFPAVFRYFCHKGRQPWDTLQGTTLPPFSMPKNHSKIQAMMSS